MRTTAFVLLMLAASFFAYRKATEPFDYWMYVAAVGDTSSASQHIPPEIIQQRMGFYSVKPLFLASCRITATFLGPQRAVNFVTVLFYFLTGTVVWLWAERRTLLSILLVTSFTVMDAARLGTPDTMQAFFLLFGAWLLTRGNRYYWVPLLLSVWVRADAAILGCLLVASDAYRQKQIPWAILPIAASAIWLEVGYRQLVSFTTQGSYLHGMMATFTNGALTLLFPFVLLGALAWKAGGDRWMLAIAGLAHVFHIILFPNADTRYALVPCLIVGVQAILACQCYIPQK
jgi:hypothetical protein